MESCNFSSESNLRASEKTAGVSFTGLYGRQAMTVPLIRLENHARYWPGKNAWFTRKLSEIYSSIYSKDNGLFCHLTTTTHDDDVWWWRRTATYDDARRRQRTTKKRDDDDDDEEARRRWRSDARRETWRQRTTTSYGTLRDDERQRMTTKCSRNLLLQSQQKFDSGKMCIPGSWSGSPHGPKIISKVSCWICFYNNTIVAQKLRYRP